MCHDGSADNQICMKKDQLHNCPITALEIVSMDKYPDWQTEKSDWSSVKLDEDVLIRYSKNVDALPITTFGLDVD